MEKAPILILHASQQPYLSIGRHFGGVKAFGKEYSFISEHDAFLDKKYMPKYRKHIKTDSWESFIEYVKSI